MTGDKDFDFFVKNGYLEGFPKATPLAKVLAAHGEDLNGLTYGIIKIGCIEIHIYDEMVNGVSYRPDLPFDRKDFTDAPPWIMQQSALSGIETELQSRGIDYKKYTVQGPLDDYKAAGVHVYIEDGEHVFIDTIGGVTFLFDPNKNGKMLACEVCRYYDLDKE